MDVILEKKQAVCILVNLICIKMIMTYPRIIVKNSGNAAWINIIYITLIALFLYYIITKLYNPEYGDIISAAKTIGGKHLMRITGIIIAVLFIINISFTVRSYPETVKTVLLHETNISVISISYLIAAAAAAYLGFESNARIHAIFIPIAGIVLAGFFLLSMPYWRLNNIMPILGNGVVPLFGSGATFVSIFSDIIMLNFFMKNMRANRDIKISGYNALIISGIVSLLILGTYNIIYPYPSSTEFIMPMYQISRLVALGPFFQRWEAFFQFIWSIGIYLYTSVYIIFISQIIAKSFDIRFSKPLILPVSVLIGWTAFIADMGNTVFNLQIMSYIITLFVFFLPLIYGVILRFKRSDNS